MASPDGSDDSASAEKMVRPDDTDGDALAPAKLRNTEVAYAIIDGRVTQVQVATAADLTAAAADVDADDLPIDVDDDLETEERDQDEDSMEVSGGTWRRLVGPVTWRRLPCAGCRRQLGAAGAVVSRTPPALGESCPPPAARFLADCWLFPS